MLVNIEFLFFGWEKKCKLHRKVSKKHSAILYSKTDTVEQKYFKEMLGIKKFSIDT